jgi:hypothetical protein
VRFTSETEEYEGGLDISCDLCESLIGHEYQNALGTWVDNLPEGTISFEVCSEYVDICPECRYSGAGAHLAELQFKEGRMGIEISGGLHTVYRYLRQTQTNISQAGYRLAELHAPDFDEGAQKAISLDELTRAYHNMGEIISIVGNVINELEFVGWPIGKAYEIKNMIAGKTVREWPEKQDHIA